MLIAPSAAFNIPSISHEIQCACRYGDLSIYITIWEFPIIGIPLNHQILIGISIINHPAIGLPPVVEPPYVYIYINCNISLLCFMAVIEVHCRCCNYILYGCMVFICVGGHASIY